jgi:hypothetical protein
LRMGGWLGSRRSRAMVHSRRVSFFNTLAEKFLKGIEHLTWLYF